MSPSRFSHGNVSYGPYKPVPPPKPFANGHISTPADPSQLHQVHTQTEGRRRPPYADDKPHALLNGHAPHSHVLVTDQGQFVTHSSKFPVEDDRERLVKLYNEINSNGTVQGFDNPGLVCENSLRNGEQMSSVINDASPNHYAQMRPYNPSKHNQRIPNGHYQGYPRIQVPYHPEINWPMRTQTNTAMSSNIPATSQNQEMTRQVFTNERSSCHSSTMYDRSHYYQQKHPVNGNNIVRENGTAYDINKNTLYRHELNFTSQNCSNGNTHAHLNGVVNNEKYGQSLNSNSFSVGEQGRTKENVVVSNGHVIQADQNEDEEKKDDKWGSLKRAGKKYSSLKNILANKFNKTDMKTQSTGSNTENNIECCKKEEELESKKSIQELEEKNNGENHINENLSSKKSPTYSSIKFKQEIPPHQHHNATATPQGSLTNGSGVVSNKNVSVRFSTNYSNSNGPQSTLEKQIQFPKRVDSSNQTVPSALKQRHAQQSRDSHLHNRQQHPPCLGILRRSDDNLVYPLASDQSYPEYVRGHSKEGVSVRFQSPPSEERGSGESDSGRGTGGGSATEQKGHDTSLESGSSNKIPHHSHSSGNESEWIDISESIEHPPSFQQNSVNRVRYPNGAKTPPLPPLSPESSPLPKRIPVQPKKHSNSFSSKEPKKPDILQTTEDQTTMHIFPNRCQSSSTRCKTRLGNTHPASKEWHGANSNDRGTQGRSTNYPSRNNVSEMNGEITWRHFEKRKPIEEDDELTSLEGGLDEVTEATSDDDDLGGLSRDEDTYLIRRQLEGLEGMYSEVLKALGGGSRRAARQQDLRFTRRRNRGSISSLPSSIVSSRAPRDRKGKVIDDRLRRPIKDISKNTHKRFQRLESHVVTLARSVAHLSSEMRNQQHVVQDIESIRNDLSDLKISVKGSSGGHNREGVMRSSNIRLWNGGVPGKVKKLTQFFGDEPPLVRIFLRRLGYEKYANIFENEKIGMLELPYMTEERLQKLGIPLGPRLRILEESRGPITTDGNLSIYVV